MSSNYGISKLNANVREYTKGLEGLNAGKNIQNANKTDSSKALEKKPTLNLDNDVKISVKNNKLPEFKPTINFLSNEKNMNDSLKVEHKNTIKDSVNLNDMNKNVNNKVAEEILKSAVAQ